MTIQKPTSYSFGAGDAQHAGHLGAAPDRIPEEAAARQLALDLLGHECRVEYVEEPDRRPEGAVRTQGEDRVALDFLDFQRG